MKDKNMIKEQLMQLKANEQQLRAEIAERKKAEEALKTANQQLRASEQQLKAANQQLRASEQQLKAANQQLRASDQQLRAANQQLLASEQQLRASNQQLRASDQQLRAANQQLRASEQQLQAANQQLKANNLQLQREITERKQAEEALRASERRIKVLFENLPQKIFYKDKNSVYISCNENYARDLKIKPEEIVGKTDYDFYPKELAEKYRGDDARIIELGKVEDIEEGYIQDGQERFVHTVKTPIKNENGEPIGVLGIFWDITERKQAERSHLRLISILEATPDFVGFADAKDKHIEYINSAGRRMCGIGKDEDVTKLKIFDVHPDWVNKMFSDEILPVAVREGTWMGECAFLNIRDGHEIPVLMVLSSHKAPNGEVEIFSTISRDITERKKTEVELCRVNRALKVISECNQVLVRVTNEPNLLNEICRNLVGVGGYRLAWVGFVQQDEGKTMRPVAQAGYEEEYLENLNITWSDTERGQEPTGTAIRTGKVYVCRNILIDQKFEPWRTEAKKYGYASCIAIPLIAENQTLGALNIYANEPDAFDKEEVNLLSELANDLAFGIVALRTRVEREQAQEALKKLSSAVEQTADIVIITDKDGVIEYVNPAFERVTGYVKEEVIGQTPRILKSGKHEQKFYETLWKTILSGNVFRDTLINRKKNGEFYYAEKTITPIRDAEGNITHFVSTDKDVTEHKEIEKTQRLAQLGELVADMAHEVNNPLMIISGNAQLCLMEEMLKEGVKNNLKIITEECQKAKSIIQRLLKFSRPSKGELKETDINKNIESVVSILEHQFKLANIEIKRNYAENLPFIFVDEKQMQEVFMNLLNNARDAMSDGGVIEICTKLEREFMRIDFKDTGCGMSEEVKKRLFEPFFTTKEKGTGLGLSVCYGIIKFHNGELRFESELEKGTTATILLPLKDRTS